MRSWRREAARHLVAFLAAMGMAMATHACTSACGHTADVDDTLSAAEVQDLLDDWDVDDIEAIGCHRACQRLAELRHPEWDYVTPENSSIEELDVCELTTSAESPSLEPGTVAVKCTATGWREC